MGLLLQKKKRKEMHATELKVANSTSDFDDLHKRLKSKLATVKEAFGDINKKVKDIICSY